MFPDIAFIDLKEDSVIIDIGIKKAVDERYKYEVLEDLYEANADEDVARKIKILTLIIINYTIKFDIDNKMNNWRNI